MFLRDLCRKVFASNRGKKWNSTDFTQHFASSDTCSREASVATFNKYCTCQYIQIDISISSTVSRLPSSNSASKYSAKSKFTSSHPGSKTCKNPWFQLPLKHNLGPRDVHRKTCCNVPTNRGVKRVSIGFSHAFFQFFARGFAFCLKQQHQKVQKCMGEEYQRSKWGTDNLTCRTCRTTSQVWEACHGACHMWDIFQGSFWWQIHPEIAKKVETKHHVSMKHVMSHQNSVRRKTERHLRPSFLVFFLANLKYRAFRTHKISFQSDAATWVSPRVKAHSHRSAGVANVASGL